MHDARRENDRNYYLKAAIYRELDNPVESIRQLALALEHNPDHEPSQKLLVRIEEALGMDKSEVVRAYNQGSTGVYKPSPAGSETAEFFAAINAMNPWGPK